MDRHAIMREFPIGGHNDDGCLYDPVTATVIGAIALGGQAYGAYEQRQARKDAQAQAAKSEQAARDVQAKQAEQAMKEKTAADKLLAKQQQRLLTGRQGRGGLLFGSELGVQANQTQQKQTLGE